MSDLTTDLEELRSFVALLKQDREEQKRKEEEALREKEAERWTRWAALWIVVLAVTTSFAGQKAGSLSGKSMKAFARATNKWEYYNAISIKLHFFERERAKLATSARALAPGLALTEAEKDLRYMDEKIAFYRKRKPEVGKIAEQADKDSERYQKHGPPMGVALSVLQLAIAVASLSVIAKKRWLWMVSIAAGLFGGFQVLNGIFLFLV